MRGEMRRREVVIRFAEHLGEVMHAVVEEEGAVDPEIAALRVLDPRLHVRQRVKEAAQRIGGRWLWVREPGASGFHMGRPVRTSVDDTLNHAGMKKAEPHAAAPPEGLVSITGALP
jgi:hypothetical protein